MTEERCPWSGQPCECPAYPWLTASGTVPPECEARMPDELLGHRKVSEAGKRRYEIYQDEIETNRRKTG